jgi:hypothetical protein
LPKGKAVDRKKSALICLGIDVKRIANESTGRESRLTSADAAQTIVEGLKRERSTKLPAARKPPLAPEQTWWESRAPLASRIRFGRILSVISQKLSL